MNKERQPSKVELLQWIKDLTKIPASKLEDLSTGVHFCHLLHIYTSGNFSLNKLKNHPQSQLDSLHNLKLLQYGMEDNRIPYKFDIVPISKKNFRTILQMLQLWRKLFQKISKNDPQFDYQRPKATIQITKPLNLDEAEISEKKVVKTPCVLTHEEAVQILESKNKSKPPLEPLIPQNAKTKEEKQEDKESLYPTIIYPAFTHCDEPISWSRKNEVSEEKVQPKTESRYEFPISRNKMNCFSFGIQTSPQPPKNDRSAQDRSAAKVKHTQQKEDSKEDNHIHNNYLKEPLSPSLKKEQNNPEAVKNTSRTPLIEKSMDRPETLNKESKSKQQYFASKHKSIPKPSDNTPHQSIEKRDLSPKLSDKTSLMSRSDLMI